MIDARASRFRLGDTKDKSGQEQAGSQRGGTLHMSAVWSCNEWDQLEEVIAGNPLHARFPTPDRST